MNLKSRLVKSLCALGVCAPMAVGAMAATESSVDAKPGCVCPLYIAPVVCKNGETYSNICFARCYTDAPCKPVGPSPMSY